MYRQPLLKVGIVNFINTSGIYIPWQDRQNAISADTSPWHVVEGPPSLLNRMLKAGEIDVGLISSYAYGMDLQDYYMFPNLGISAAGPVGSVFLVTRNARGLHEVANRSLLLTLHSATSVNLLRLILEHFYGIIPRYQSGNLTDFESDDSFEGYLAIGDEALQLKKHRADLFFFDLAEIWQQHTGLPFVFAVWAVRKEAWEQRPEAVSDLYKHILSCYREGLQKMEAISVRVASRAGLSAKECLNYLHGIQLHLDATHIKALEHFFKLLHDSFNYPIVSDLHILPL